MPGTPGTRFIVLRGNSGSGKSSAARALRERSGRKLAWVEQDYLRRVVLKELDQPGGVNIGVIEQRRCAAPCNTAITSCWKASWTPGATARCWRVWPRSIQAAPIYYFDLSFEETVRRHATRPQASEFCPEAMREWYKPADLLPFASEHVFDESLSLAEVVDMIVASSGLED